MGFKGIIYILKFCKWKVICSIGTITLSCPDFLKEHELTNFRLTRGGICYKLVPINQILHRQCHENDKKYVIYQ